MRILIAEDDPGCRMWLETLLARLGYDVVVCEDGLSAWRILQEPDAPKIAILDWMMPRMDGLEVCHAVRAQADRQYTYLILLTGKTQKKDLLTGFRAGADDFVTKPGDEDELQVRLQVGQRILTWQEQLIAVREQLRVQATRDALTGLWNRGAVCDLLEKELCRGRRENKSVGVVLIDLDHFKRINDTYGHPAGDAVLREAGRRMAAGLRAYDLVGRYGGEEFLAVLPGCSEAALLQVCERLREALAASPVPFEGQAVPLSASLGAVMSGAHTGAELEAASLLRAADRALYQAKTNGRNQVVLAAV